MLTTVSGNSRRLLLAASLTLLPRACKDPAAPQPVVTTPAEPLSIIPSNATLRVPRRTSARCLRRRTLARRHAWQFRIRVVLLVICSLVLVISCSGVPHQTSRYFPNSRRALTGADLDHPNAANALELIRLRRPEFLRSGGPTAEHAPIVYIDGIRGLIEDLRSLPAGSLLEIRYLTAAEATVPYGYGHPAGAIVVTTGTRQRLD